MRIFHRVSGIHIYRLDFAMQMIRTRDVEDLTFFFVL